MMLAYQSFVSKIVYGIFLDRRAAFVFPVERPSQANDYDRIASAIEAKMVKAHESLVTRVCAEGFAQPRAELIHAAELLEKGKEPKLGFKLSEYEKETLLMYYRPS